MKNRVRRGWAITIITGVGGGVIIGGVGVVRVYRRRGRVRRLSHPLVVAQRRRMMSLTLGVTLRLRTLFEKESKGRILLPQKPRCVVLLEA